MAGTNPEILLISAEAELVEGLRELLSGAGYALRVASSLEAAQRAYRKLRAPGVVLLDWALPGAQQELPHQLRAARPNEAERLPVVVLAGPRESPEGEGIVEVVSLPVEDPLLLEVLQRQLERL